ncbi:MAG: hypothetical protein KJT03_21375, partial [Verrucomicrobiae bacterium]|nr:hypothetical protein [Verrucomicrobiae bacterium]
PTFTATNDQGSDVASTEMILEGTYNYWFDVFFNEDEKQDPLVSGPEGDALGDGVLNIFKYVFAYPARLSPVPDGIPQFGTVFVDDKEYISLTYTYDITATDVTLTVRVSGGLDTWNSGPGFTTEISRESNLDGTETVVVRDNIPIGDEVTRFIQLLATY